MTSSCPPPGHGSHTRHPGPRFSSRTGPLSRPLCAGCIVAPPSPPRGGTTYGKVVGVQAERAAEIFAEQRSYLLGVSYRLTGSWADAEDLVAEAWPRWAEHADEVVDPRAWLTRVVGRLSLDHLRSARVRRETYVGPWLPEPLITAAPV
ncbi:MAG: hypothetical protein H0T99_00920, partial [Geodermatophilaceae bacterium]|nr:hypothetical protein [Geodermatophilaceae bacterium]